MIVKLKEIEPFDVSPKIHNDVQQFLKHLTGEEIFEFKGNLKPISILFFDIFYRYPLHSTAYGILLSIEVDIFLNICNNTNKKTIDIILNKYSLGKIKLEIGNNSVIVKITAYK